VRLDGTIIVRAKTKSILDMIDFSLGRLDHLTVMQALGINSDEDLFLLMAYAHLPMPRLPERQTREMVDSLHALSS
jgi:hypothetical protein